MFQEQSVSVIIPAYNEADSIGKVIASIPNWVDDVIVADNNSTDATAQIARALGARVIVASHQGYGAACLAGIAALDKKDIIVFLDGDFSDYPEDMTDVITPIATRKADMVIGSRTLGDHEAGALLPQAIFGNWLACFLINLFWGIRFTDLGPFRAIRFASLQQLGMVDQDYGWTVEMQIKAVQKKLKCVEVPVRYRKRIGKSKITGTLKGVWGAGTKILGTLFSAKIQEGLPKQVRPVERLIIFTRYPIPGKTKTRMIPGLGAVGAAELQRQMTAQMVLVARQVRAVRPLEIEICVTGASNKKFYQWLGNDLTIRRQGRGDLGAKMSRAFARAFRQKRKRTIIIGIDCPQIDAPLLEQAFDELEKKRLVMGPAKDGGYYLVGLTEHQPRLFQQIHWGTETVWEQTLGRIEQDPQEWAQLQTLADIDQPEDVALWKKHMNDRMINGKPLISIILPVLNEAKTLQTTLSGIAYGPAVEIIVVDGHSSDHSQEIARDNGATVIVSQPNRAVQMNLGAQKAKGEILLFLHGDTQLAGSVVLDCIELLSRPGVVMGAFTLAIDSTRVGIRFIEWMVHLRSRWFSLPYGDQGFFMSKTMFKQVKGFEAIPIMEDYALAKQMKKLGRIAITDAKAITSGRRWKRLGIWKTTLINQWIIVGYHLRRPLKTLQKIYSKK